MPAVAPGYAPQVTGPSSRTRAERIVRSGIASGLVADRRGRGSKSSPVTVNLNDAP